MALASGTRLGPYEILALRMYRLDLATDRRKLRRELMPPIRRRVVHSPPHTFPSDGKSYAYNYRRTLSELFLAAGLELRPSARQAWVAR